MTFAPVSLQNLSSYLKSQDVPVLGIVGNAAHTYGYHLGRDRIYRIPPGRGDQDYSVRNSRDKAGLSDAAAAMDIGRHDRLIELGRYLRGRLDIRELIAERGDGSHIWRWDAVTGKTTGDGASDELPHHLHVSWFRDSQQRDKTAVFRAFYQPPPPPEDIVYSIPESDGPYPATVKAGTPLYGSATDKTPNTTLNDPSRPYTVVGAGSGATATTGRRAIHGRYAGKVVPLGWVEVGRLVR